MPSPGHSCLLSYSVRLYRSQSSNRYQNLCGLTNCDCFVTLARPTVVLTGSPGLLSNKGSSTFQSTAVLWYLLLRLQGLPQSGKGGVNNCPWAVKWCTSPQSPSASQPWFWHTAFHLSSHTCLGEDPERWPPVCHSGKHYCLIVLLCSRRLTINFRISLLYVTGSSWQPKLARELEAISHHGVALISQWKHLSR